MITRLYYRVPLSIHSTQALFHKYFVAMRYRWICNFLILCESQSIKSIYKSELQNTSISFILYKQRLFLLKTIYMKLTFKNSLLNKWPFQLYNTCTIKFANWSFTNHTLWLWNGIEWYYKENLTIGPLQYCNVIPSLCRACTASSILSQ